MSSTKNYDQSKIFERLRAPFPVESVQWRVGARSSDKKRGQALPYLTARDVQERLDEVVGPENWKNELLAAPNGNGVMCVISLKVAGEWVSKADIAQQDDISGAEHGTDKADKKLEIAVKGAASDAFKRAAVLWGIGRYLYAIEAPWCNLEMERYIPDREIPMLKRFLRESIKGGRPSTIDPSLAKTESSETPSGGEIAESEAVNPKAQDFDEPSSRKARPAVAASNKRAISSSKDCSESANDASRNQQSSVANGLESHKPKHPDKPIFCSEEQWAALPETQKTIVRTIRDRLMNKTNIGQVETYLTEGQGSRFPDWLKAGLLNAVKNGKSRAATQH